MPPKRRTCTICSESRDLGSNGICDLCTTATRFAQSVRFGSVKTDSKLVRIGQIECGRQQFSVPVPKTSKWYEPLTETIANISYDLVSYFGFISQENQDKNDEKAAVDDTLDVHGFPVKNSPLRHSDANPIFKSNHRSNNDDNHNNERAAVVEKIDLIQPISAFSSTAVIVPKTEQGVQKDRPLFGENPDLKPAVKRAVLFVHGYCNGAESAIRRASILKWDLIRLQVDPEFDMLAFTWPSANKFTHYTYDEESMAFSTTYFKEWATNTFKDYDSVTIIPHSMGNRVVTYGLELLDQDTLKKVERVIFTAPDIDLEVFSSKLQTIQKKHPFEYKIFCNPADKAVLLSCELHNGKQRVGTCSAEELEKHGHKGAYQYTGSLLKLMNFHDYCFTIPECTEQMAKFIIKKN